MSGRSPARRSDVQPHPVHPRRQQLVKFSPVHQRRNMANIKNCDDFDHCGLHFRPHPGEHIMTQSNGKTSAWSRALLLAGAVTALATLGVAPIDAADKTIKVGITLPLTGADAEDATLIKNGALLAIEEANAKGGVAGYKIEAVVYDSGTATAGQYDPAQAATNTKKLVADPAVVANIGPV